MIERDDGGNKIYRGYLTIDEAIDRLFEATGDVEEYTQTFLITHKLFASTLEVISGATETYDRISVNVTPDNLLIHTR